MKDYFSKDVQNRKEWSDWHWQIQNRLTAKEQFQEFLTLSEEEIQGFEYSSKGFSVGVTPYVLSKMDRNNANCPIRKQFIPSGKEQYVSSMELDDPCNEDSHSPVPGIVHRYPDRVLFLVTNVCSVYCRYCTRSRLVGSSCSLKFNNEMFENALEYIKSNSNIRDVLISGGDPLLLSDERLEKILSSLREIKHVELIRIGTRMPITVPQRITDKLCNILKKYHPLFISLHINHPAELTEEVKIALAKLSDAGVPLGSQTVLLNGVNDSSEVMKNLVHKLLSFRVRPYYLYQCDLVKGTSHLRTSIAKGMEVMRKLRGFTSGYAIPTYVIDAPGGGGKIPIESSNVVSQRDGVISLRNWEGKVFDYYEDSASHSHFEREVQEV